MPSLRELQQRFTTAMFQGGTAGLDADIVENGLPADARLGVYRESILGNLTSALAHVYPVIERLVGEAFFESAAREYVRRHPSVSGDLHEFGGEFPGFLAEFPPAAELEYLPDVAQLEWHCHRVFHAADQPPLSIEKLAVIAPEDYTALRFSMHPACRLFSSDYPVHRIWEVNQPTYLGDQAVDLAAGGVSLLITRGPSAVELHTLGEGELALLEALAADMPLSRATDLALAAEPEFELGPHLQHHIARATLVDFRT